MNMFPNPHSDIEAKRRRRSFCTRRLIQENFFGFGFKQKRHCNSREQSYRSGNNTRWIFGFLVSRQRQVVDKLNVSELQQRLALAACSSRLALWKLGGSRSETASCHFLEPAAANISRRTIGWMSAHPVVVASPTNPRAVQQTTRGPTRATSRPCWSPAAINFLQRFEK
jgi:hypothetical protein